MLKQKGLNPKKKIRWAFLFLVLIVAISVLCMHAYKDINKKLYQERSYNSIRLMEKLSQNIDTVLNDKWSDIHYLSKQMMYEKFNSIYDVQNTISEMEICLAERMNNVFVIDSEGLCYTSYGERFHWPDNSVLNTSKESVYVSEIDALKKNTEQIFFLTKFPKSINVEGVNLTHIVLASNIKTLDEFFNVSDYGDSSSIFVIRKNGTPIYSRNIKNNLSNIYNVIDKTEICEYHYDTSREKIENDIAKGKSGCACISYDKENYYLNYQKLNVDDWYAILMVPEREVGSNSAEFMKSIIYIIGIIAIVICVLPMAVILLSSYRIRNQQKSVNESLRKAAEAERNANHAKTQFLSAMSHDIRTPMNAITGMTMVAAKHLDEPDYIKECLEKITLASKHLLTLINDILDISKVESGKMTLNPTVFSLAESVTNLSDILCSQIKEKSLNFNIRIHKINHEYLYADKLRLNQIYINIFTNAVKYTNSGGSIILDLKEEIIADDPEKIRLKYIVQDTGIGMSKEFMQTMYEIFSRATDSRINKIHGSGLGLAITKQMVDLMHGTIECESEIGMGTKFTVTIDLPIAENVNDDFTLPESHVLLVDDDRIFLESAKDTLESMGLIVDCCDSGEDAVKMVCNKHEAGEDYSLIIVDWKMPNMNGIEIIRAIREKIGSGVKIAVSSAYDWSDIEDEAKNAGADGFINKPLFRSTAYYNINEIMNLKTQVVEVEDDNTGDLNGMNILIAEDNELNWEIIEELLRVYGISSTRAKNGQVCVDIITSASEGMYDLILMDVQMPVMNGKDATRKIRSNPEKYINSIPIIAMTADAFAEDINSCLEAGMDGHISKPIDLKKLLKELRKIKKNN